MTTTYDPSKKYEELFAQEQDALAWAKRYEDEGKSAYLVKFSLNRARGIKAARTRLARVNGWIA